MNEGMESYPEVVKSTWAVLKLSVAGLVSHREEQRGSVLRLPRQENISLRFILICSHCACSMGTGVFNVLSW